jgi:intein/homing endonuclease
MRVITLGSSGMSTRWVRINTDKGLFRIQDIVEFDGDFELQTFFGPAKINKRWCNGKKEVFRYETEKGYRLDCTLDHRVYAVRDYSKKKHLARASLLKNHTEWVRAEDLRLGDALVLDFSEKRFSEDYVR